VISGPESGIEAVLDALEQDYVSARRLRVSHAFHSPLIEPALERFEAAAARIRCRAPALPLASNVTGGLLDSGFAPDAAYWRRHARAPVRFHENLSALAVGAGCRVFLELGPSRTLAEIGRRAGVAADACWLASLERGESDWSALLRALAALHVRGVEIDWAGFDAPYPRRRRALPTYPFERERCWLEPGEIRDLVRRREGQAWA
jgi:acyl transferase domain-containing protein